MQVGQHVGDDPNLLAALAALSDAPTSSLQALVDARRVSAQRSLANLSGDYKTLELMEKIARKQIGIFDPEISDSIRSLRGRIYRGAIVDSSSWTGRPSGGAF